MFKSMKKKFRIGYYLGSQPRAYFGTLWDILVEVFNWARTAQSGESIEITRR